MSFTPICTSIDGLFGPETTSFIKRMAERIASNTQKPYRAKISFAILRATNLCIRGTRYKIKSIDSIIFS